MILARPGAGPPTTGTAHASTQRQPRDAGLQRGNADRPEREGVPGQRLRPARGRRSSTTGRKTRRLRGSTKRSTSCHFRCEGGPRCRQRQSEASTSRKPSRGFVSSARTTAGAPMRSTPASRSPAANSSWSLMLTACWNPRRSRVRSSRSRSIQITAWRSAAEFVWPTDRGSSADAWWLRGGVSGRHRFSSICAGSMPPASRGQR